LLRPASTLRFSCLWGYRHAQPCSDFLLLFARLLRKAKSHMWPPEQRPHEAQGGHVAQTQGEVLSPSPGLKRRWGSENLGCTGLGLGLGTQPSQACHVLPFPTTSPLLVVDPADSPDHRLSNSLAFQPTSFHDRAAQAQAQATWVPLTGLSVFLDYCRKQ
jgi:hypothetical protein